MEIREAKPEDAECIRSVHYDSIRKLGLEAYSPKQVNAWSRGCHSTNYVNKICDAKLETIVTENESEITGFGILNLDPPSDYESKIDAEIQAVYMNPDYARNGHGSMIYKELEKRASKRMIAKLGLWASLNAVPFYKSHGYETVCEHVHEFSSHEQTGVTGTVIEMIKEI